MNTISKSITIPSPPYNIQGEMDREFNHYEISAHLSPSHSFLKRVYYAFRVFARKDKMVEAEISIESARKLRQHILKFIDLCDYDYNQGDGVYVGRHNTNYPDGNIDQITLFCACGMIDCHATFYGGWEDEEITVMMNIDYYRYLLFSPHYLLSSILFWQWVGDGRSSMWHFREFLRSVKESVLVTLFQYVFLKEPLFITLSLFGKPVAKEFQKVFLQFIEEQKC